MNNVFEKNKQIPKTWVTDVDGKVKLFIKHFKWESSELRILHLKVLYKSLFISLAGEIANLIFDWKIITRKFKNNDAKLKNNGWHSQPAWHWKHLC